MIRNRIKSKSVGSVKIFEISGDFSGDFASKGKSAIRDSMKNHTRKNVLFNLGGVNNIDDLGVSAVVSNLDCLDKFAVLTSSETVKKRFEGIGNDDGLYFLESEGDATRFFCREFAESNIDTSFFAERRNFVRLKTVLPIELKYELDEGSAVSFFAVVTNLSEGGLYAEFIQADTEERARQILNPYDLKMIHLKLHLDSGDVMQGKGKLIHGSIVDGGIGVEFYDLQSEAKTRIREWIAKHILRYERGEATQ